MISRESYGPFDQAACTSLKGVGVVVKKDRLLVLISFL